MDIESNKSYKILFVCLGNICRSPAAHAVMQHYIDQENLSRFIEIDSAGLYGGHAGELPDKRMRIHAARRGYELIHRSRKVVTSDFETFDFIVAMDDSNFHNLKSMAPTIEDEAKIVRMVDYCRQHPYFYSVPDPYYEGAEGFELVLDLLEDACLGLLNDLKSRLSHSTQR